MRFLTELLSQEGAAAKYHLCSWKMIISWIPSPHSIVDANLEVFKSGLYDDKTCQTIGWELKYLSVVAAAEVFTVQLCTILMWPYARSMQFVIGTSYAVHLCS